MLATQLKADILAREGRHLLPDAFRVEELIVLTREIALFTDGLLSYRETVELGRFLTTYVKKLLANQDNERLEQYENNSDDLLPLLAQDLNELIRDELVSRLIGYKSTPASLTHLFDQHFDSASSVGQTTR